MKKLGFFLLIIFGALLLGAQDMRIIPQRELGWEIIVAGFMAFIFMLFLQKAILKNLYFGISLVSIIIIFSALFILVTPPDFLAPFLSSSVKDLAFSFLLSSIFFVISFLNNPGKWPRRIFLGLNVGFSLIHYFSITDYSYPVSVSMTIGLIVGLPTIYIWKFILNKKRKKVGEVYEENHITFPNK